MRGNHRRRGGGGGKCGALRHPPRVGRESWVGLGVGAWMVDVSGLAILVWLRLLFALNQGVGYRQVLDSAEGCASWFFLFFLFAGFAWFLGLNPCFLVFFFSLSFEDIKGFDFSGSLII